MTIQQLVKNEGLVCLEREVDKILPKDTKMGRMVFAVFEMTVRRTLKYFHRRTCVLQVVSIQRRYDMSRLDTSFFSRGLNSRDL